MGRDWKSCLTKAEAAAIRRIEAKINRLEGDLTELRRRRQIIQNRATARAGRQ